MRLPPLSLVLGGASSGKSAFAERIVRQSGLAKVYVASAIAQDAEMSAKIALHRNQRAGDGWRTIEAPRQTTQALAQIKYGEVALLDCITFWLTNLMIDDDDWEEELNLMIGVLNQMTAPVVLVSNDVSGGIVPENALARRFQRAQGVTNQRLAAQCDLVIQVTAGLPRLLKGTSVASDTDGLW